MVFSILIDISIVLLYPVLLNKIVLTRTDSLILEFKFPVCGIPKIQKLYRVLWASLLIMILTLAWCSFLMSCAGVDRLKSRSSVGSRGELLAPKDAPDLHIAAQTFTFRELAAATRNFRPECFIGEGGFGRVYKGRLESTDQVKILIFLFSTRKTAISESNHIDGFKSNWNQCLIICS